MRDQRRCLGAIARHAPLEHGGIVIRPHRFATAPRLPRPLQNPLQQGCLVDCDVQHRIEFNPAFGQRPVERLGLCQRPRIAVQDEAALGFLLC